MRVTNNTFTNSLLFQLQRLSSRQAKLQQQAATGQRVTFPEDDPAAMRRVMDLQTDARSADQYLRNISRNKEIATTSFASLKSLNSVLDRASEIATLADPLRSPEDLKIYAAEVDQLIQQALELVNARDRGSYVFGGTRSSEPPFVATRDEAGMITGVTYQGSTDVPESEIGAGVTVSAHVPGANTSGTGARGLVTDSRTGADLFHHLIALRDNLRAGDSDAIVERRRELLADEENLTIHLGTNGAFQARLESASSVLERRRMMLESLVSSEADADLADTIVRLTEVQTAYQAALQSGGSILTRSLMDYLR